MEHNSNARPEPSDQWAIVELFGHQRIAGRVSEQTIGGCAFVRVDIPAFEAAGTEPATQAFTKLYGQGAIYAMSFVDAATAKMVGRQLRVQPIETYELRRALQDLPALGASPQLDLDDDDRPF
ncbi:hypothetical protein [Paraburkholderia caballeronis]|uniref:hypothetical protein n=1 Tax=Paraburkholderia caballeronis TaxID=416943 RepID=UPI00106706C8|nr:hypothetical protein [Paraburkholderia caballeronis]TDV04649.1 hypothetical protein C7408_13111 [Paraburkholderia caballeronis]TDV07892.1 hypothetical protein C7406_13311 [Paraburkholderia caballeronis]TDV18183.1 hypothetical protein C7404_13111 [Paraburkholderia caballeronis]